VSQDAESPDAPPTPPPQPVQVDTTDSLAAGELGEDSDTPVVRFQLPANNILQLFHLPEPGDWFATVAFHSAVQSVAIHATMTTCIQRIT